MIRECYSILYTFIYTMLLNESAMHACLLMIYNMSFAQKQVHLELHEIVQQRYQGVFVTKLDCHRSCKLLSG